MKYKYPLMLIGRVSISSPILLILLIFNYTASAISDSVPREVNSFNKIIISPHVKLILEPGDTESVLITDSKVEEHKINVKVFGKTLRIYLDDAKEYTRHKRTKSHGIKNQTIKKPIYTGTMLTARVTYKELKKLSIRGEEQAECKGQIKSDKFKLKIFGQADVEIASIDSEQVKTSLYGENELRIADGKIGEHSLKSYGENRVDSQNVSSIITKTTSFGESNINLNASEKVKVTLLGESEVNVTGGGKVYRGIVIGENKIYEYYSKSTD